MAPKQWLSPRAVVVLELLLLVAVVVAADNCESVEEEVEALALSDDTEALELLSNLTNRQGNNCGFSRPRWSRSSHRVAGGYQAAPGEYPSYVQVLAHNMSCGGTIVSDRIILTAAHCFNGLPLPTTIVAGSIDINTGFQFNVRVCLPEGPWRAESDVAVLITDIPIRFDESIQPACMPQFDVNPNSQAYVVGFGLITKQPQMLKPRYLQVLPIRRANRFPPGSNLISYISNTPNYKGDACEGDSGGPVYVDIGGRQTVVGIVSGGQGNCQAGRSDPGVYINVHVTGPLLRDLVGRCQSE